MESVRPTTSVPDLMQRAVEYVVFAVVAVIWGVVGLAFWIPILARAVGTISVAVGYATLSGDRSRLGEARNYLDEASDFWFSGFRNARTAMDGDSDQDEVGRLGASLDGIEWGPLFANVAWTGIFWLAVRLIFL